MFYCPLKSGTVNSLLRKDSLYERCISFFEFSKKIYRISELQDLLCKKTILVDTRFSSDTDVFLVTERRPWLSRR